MAGKQKRLQVFISSTFEDMKKERQAAVEAILTAGHIPAGMELFAAGDQSQMEVIKRWIDQSDVFLLILGGRYGSIEPVSGKSYIQLEYEYAVAKRMALFAVVIKESYLDKKVKRLGRNVLEAKNPQKLEKFRSMVSSNLVEFWGGEKDIQLAILKTLASFSLRAELVGWVPGDQAVNAGALAEQIARLSKENDEFRSKLASLKEPTYFGLDFHQFSLRLSSEALSFDPNEPHLQKSLSLVATAFGDPTPSVIHGLWFFRNYLLETNKIRRTVLVNSLFAKIFKYGFLTPRTVAYPASNEYQNSTSDTWFELSENGREFLIRFSAQKDDDMTRPLEYKRG